MVSIMLFTRGLRLADNTALNAIVRTGTLPILPVFVFTPEQADAERNKYFSGAAFRYMVETLEELDADLAALGGRLYTFRGDTVEVLERIRKTLAGAGTPVAAVYENLDITPYARERSARIAKWAAGTVGGAVKYVGFQDVDLVPMERGRMGASESAAKLAPMYSVFTAYWRNMVARELPCMEPLTVAPLKRKSVGVWATPTAGMLKGAAGVLPAMRELARSAIVPPEDYASSLSGYANPGGRREAVRRLKAFVAAGKMAAYGAGRDFPARPATSRLSAAIRFGVLSVREVAWAAAESDSAVGWKSDWIRELVWRSFYYHWMWDRPELLKTSFHAAYDRVAWKITRESDAGFQRFARGETGFPLIDAGVRELTATGWSHNRIRMMLATFVVKGLRADWRVGERWMARLLRDHDVVSNAMGWQWGHSAAPSAQPYFRVMSPWAQSKRFDADAEYIKRWVPELAAVAARDIHRWGEEKIREKYATAPASESAGEAGTGAGTGAGYPAPMFDWKTAATEAIAAYRAANAAV